MFDLPPSPVPGNVAGGHAKHFNDVPTDRLVAEMQALWYQQENDDALDEARSRGDYTVYTFLVALHERADRSVLDAAATLVASSQPITQVQGLQILRELGPPAQRPIFPEIWDIIEPLASPDTDLDVLAWALRVLVSTGKPQALPTLLRFVDHSDPGIRSRVADGLLAVARPVDDPQAVAALLRLCDDNDPDVRWNALWEAREHLDKARPDVRAVMQRRATDPDPRVQRLLLSG